MTNKTALKELYSVIELEREIDRYHALSEWIDSWVETVSSTQSVVSKKYLTTEFADLIKLKMAESMALDLCEIAMCIKSSEREIKSEMTVLRKKAN